MAPLAAVCLSILGPFQDLPAGGQCRRWPTDGLVVFFREAALMMELPKQHATPPAILMGDGEAPVVEEFKYLGSMLISKN